METLILQPQPLVSMHCWHGGPQCCPNVEQCTAWKYANDNFGGQWLSSDGKTVYVSMQEACAVAIFDLETMEFKDIKPLPQRCDAKGNDTFSLLNFWRAAEDKVDVAQTKEVELLDVEVSQLDDILITWGLKEDPRASRLRENLGPAS